MALNLHSVVNASKPIEEIVWLEVTADINLAGHAIIDRTFNLDGKVTNEFRHIFMFPNLDVKKDDWIRVFTGRGSYSKIKIDKKPNNYIHNLYWGSDICVYNDNGGDTVSLIRYTGIKSVTVPAIKK
jgi:hypothetical protein